MIPPLFSLVECCSALGSQWSACKAISTAPGLGLDHLRVRRTAGVNLPRHQPITPRLNPSGIRHQVKAHTWYKRQTTNIGTSERSFFWLHGARHRIFRR